MESVNALVRAGILVGLTFVLCFAYLWLVLHQADGKQIGNLEGALLNLLGGAFVWFFKARDDKQRADAADKSAAIPPAPAPGAPTP